MEFQYSMSNAQNTSHIYAQVLLNTSHTYAQVNADPCFSSHTSFNLLKPGCMGCANMKYLSAKKADHVLHFLLALTQVLARKHICLYSISCHSTDILKITAQLDHQNTVLWENFHKYWSIIWSRSLSGRWLKQAVEKRITIWFWAGQPLYYASHFLYIKHIALTGQTHLSKLASFLSYTSASQWWTQKSHHLNKCHVTWQLCLCYMIIWEAWVVSGGRNGPKAFLFYLSISKTEKRRSEH